MDRYKLCKCEQYIYVKAAHGQKPRFIARTFFFIKKLSFPYKQ